MADIKTTKRGAELLSDTRLNKGSAFTQAEREALDLVGLLPPTPETEETQLQRVLQHMGSKTLDIERYIYLLGLLDRNETLFYRVLMSDPARFMPIVYTPTVGEACLKFDHLFRRARGMYLSIDRKGKVKETLRNWPEKDVRFICATSGGRILGLGDLGANGMGIAIGKLQLYTACAGIPPNALMPMVIDFGTDNETLLADPLYMGLRQRRSPKEQVDEFVEEFVQAVQEIFPKCCIHFEDWAGVDAVRLLARYRDKVCCYNDDIQGTAGAALTGLMGALRVTKNKLSDHRVLFLGGGSAGVGIADLIVTAMMLDGLSEKDARARVSLFDINGLIVSSRKDVLDFQQRYAHDHTPVTDLVAAIESLKPTILIGVSTKAKAFNQKVIETMARLNKRPVIFALSNPTDHAECTAEEAYKWSEGRALFASGVPFGPVRFGGKLLIPGQGNNVYVFPAVSLAVLATEATRVTDEMFIAAARGVAESVTQAELDAGSLYPPQSGIFETEVKAAVKVAETIFARGLARVAKPKDMEAFIRGHLYEPKYPNLV